VRHDDAARVRLYERADLLKVDCLGRRPEELKLAVENLHRNRRPLLADKLESRREVDACLAMGLQPRAGLLARAAERRQGTDDRGQPRVGCCASWSRLQDPDCGIQRMEAIVRQDVGLSFRILRCVNSAASACRARSTPSARRSCAGLDRGAQPGDPAAALELERPAARALAHGDVPRRTCELLTAELGWPEPARSFTVGLLSLFDALLGEPLNLLLVDLPGSPELRGALLEHSGPSGRGVERGEGAGARRLDPRVGAGRAGGARAEGLDVGLEWVDTLEAQFAAQAS
jgi:EAL and modified HD-GYP domain-containing signal transduction protein